jgi:hypothetical protein
MDNNAELLTPPPDPWLTAWHCFLEGLTGAPDASPGEIRAFAEELKARCPYWPPPAESMQAIQADWLKRNPGQPLPPAFFAARHGIWVPGAP